MSGGIEGMQEGNEGRSRGIDLLAGVVALMLMHAASGKVMYTHAAEPFEF
jgi:hypothetical protein